MSVLDELLGIPRNAHAQKPREDLEPSEERRAQAAPIQAHPGAGADPARALVSGSAAPAAMTPPPGPSVDDTREATQRRLGDLERHLHKLDDLVALLAEAHQRTQERDRPFYENAQIGAGVNGAYKIVTHGRPYNRVYVAAPVSVQVQLPGLPAAPSQFVVGWNTLDLPDGALLFVAAGGVAAQAVYCASAALTDADALIAAAAPGGVLFDTQPQNLAGGTLVFTSPTINVLAYRELDVQVNLSAIAGTGPLLITEVDAVLPDGSSFSLFADAGKSAAAVYHFGFGGGQSGGQSAPNPFGGLVRLKFTLSGTGPSCTVRGFIIGK